MRRREYFLQSDFSNIKNWIKDLQFQKFNQALILGVKFKARGESFCESQEPNFQDDDLMINRTITVPSNHMNKCKHFRAQWKVAQQYSSWCRYRRINHQDQYGQINLFLCITRAPNSEQHLLDEMIVSVTGRKTEFLSHTNIKNSRLGYINTSIVSYDDYRIYISCRSIYSTPVAIVALNRHNEPIPKQHQASKVIDHDNQDENDLLNDNRLDKLLLIDLEPSRMKLRIAADM